jgi:hypothetical protein
MDEGHSKLHNAAKAVQGRALGWLQQNLQLPSQENRPAQPPKPSANAAPNSCANGYESIGTNDMSPPANDSLRLKFKVSQFLLSLSPERFCGYKRYDHLSFGLVSSRGICDAFLSRPNCLLDSGHVGL